MIDIRPWLEYLSWVPEISRFLGIVIAMYHREHGPAHFHAKYGDFEITVEIERGIIQGQFPRRALAHVFEWYGLHKEELLENWALARDRQPLNPIPPLE